MPFEKVDIDLAIFATFLLSGNSEHLCEGASLLASPQALIAVVHVEHVGKSLKV